MCERTRRKSGGAAFHESIILPLFCSVLFGLIALPCGRAHALDGPVPSAQAPAPNNPDRERFRDGDSGEGSLYVPVGSVAFIFRGVVAPPSDWAGLWFDASSWQMGPTGVGYSSDVTYATALDDMKDNYVSFYIRIAFRVLDNDPTQRLELGMIYDDGFIAYINGREVARSANMIDPVVFTTEAAFSHDEEVPEQQYIIDTDRELLRLGRNVLAIEIHNVAISSSDATVVPRLRVAGNQPPNAIITFHSATVGEAPLVVTLTSTDSTDLEDDVLRSTWDFGDGTPALTTGDATISHTYDTTGTYTVTLIVTDTGHLADSVTRTVVVTEPGAPVRFVNAGDIWSFFEGWTPPPDDWAVREFDDSAWLLGPTGIGYSTDIDYATVLEGMAGNYTTFFARRAFTVKDPESCLALDFGAQYDDGFVAYLNGKEVARSANMVGPVEFDTTPAFSHDEEDPEEVFRFVVEPDMLLFGENVLAVEVHNIGPTSSDAGIVPWLQEVEVGSCLTDLECDDGLFCNGTEVCLEQRCADADDPCSSGEVCDEGLDRCTPSDAECVQDSDCHDGAFCNGVESCVKWICVAGIAPCQLEESCNETLDMCTVHECFDDANCDDALFCNGIEHCIEGACVGGPEPCLWGRICVEDKDTCHSPADGTWIAPIGIPEPTFGIVEDSPPRPEPWDEETPGFYFVERSSATASDVDNPFGTPARPRATIPNELAAGALVELHGLYDQDHSSPGKIGGVGLPDRPIFVRGVSQADAPVITRRWEIKGQYMILENLTFADDDGDLGDASEAGRPIILHPAHHVALRYCDVSGNHVTGGIGVKTTNNPAESCHDVVLFDNVIHDNGDWQIASDQDRHGVNIEFNVFNVWIVDNELYHNSGDGIQVGKTELTNRPHHIYVGRNVAWENKQTGFWVKTADDVILSQNVAFGHVPSGSSPGAGMGWQYDGERIWFLFNHVFDNTLGIRGASPNQGGTDEINLIGNVIYANDGLGVEIWSSEPSVYIVNNTLVDNGGGIYGEHCQSFYLRNNLVCGQGDQPLLEVFGSVADRTVVDHCLFHSYDEPPKFVWGSGEHLGVASLQAVSGQCASCTEDAPTFVSADNGDFHLLPGNMAINAGFADEVYSKFRSLYGLDIAVDADGMSRGQGGAFDVGAFEFPE